MSRRAALRLISDAFTRQSLCFALTSFTAFSCSLITAGLVQAGFDASASAPRLVRPTSPTPGAQEVTALEPRMPIERELAGAQKHSYQLGLTQGQYVSLTVDQRGIDVLVRMFGPDGKLIADCDSADGLKGLEDPELVAEVPGIYTFEVVAKRKDAPVGRYEIKITELRAAVERDRLLLQARISHREGVKLANQEKYDLALPPAQHALEIYEKILGEHATTATSLHLISTILIRKREYAKAEPFLERELEIKEKVLPPNDLGLAGILNNLGLNNLWRGNYEKAETLLQRALRLYENSPSDPQYPKIGHTLHCLAAIYSEQGDFAKAEAMYKRVLTIWGEAYGPESEMLAATLDDLAMNYRLSGDYVQAESLLLRAIPIAEKAAAEDQPYARRTLTEAIGTLASVYMDKGDYERAEALLERQPAILEKLGPEIDNSNFFDALVTLSRIRGNFEKAEQLSLRAIAITENMHGPEHYLVSDHLLRLATLYYYHGDYVKAEPLLQRALAIQQNQKVLGAENLTAASILDMLGSIHRARAEYAKAESLHQGALAITEKLFGSNHPNVAKTLDNLATLSAARGDGAQAVEFQARANAIDEHSISLNLNTGSERQKLCYLRSLLDKVDKTISLQLRLAPDDRRAREQSVALILQRKGRVQDVMTNSLSSLRRHLSAEDQELLGRLNATYAQLSRLVLEGSQQIPAAEQRIRIGTLEEQKEKLEAEISRRSAGFYQQSQSVTFDAIHSAVPDNAALIEFAIYRPFDPKAIEAKAFGEPRCVAYVLRKQGEVQWRELGEAKVLAVAIDQLREALRDPKRQDVRQLARALDEKLMKPVRPLLGDATQLLVSPDGALNLIPYEALVDEQNRYLIERFSFAYLASGRDLLRLQVARDSKSNPIVVANPAFGEPELTAMANAGGRGSQLASLGAKRQTVTTGSDLSDVYFAPLGGTTGEAQAIKSLFAEASVLTGTRATESSLKRVSAPRIMHIATHGFFLTDAPVPSNAIAEKTRAISASIKIANPLLRSGLALAGANLRQSGTDDGILTALEASALNLWGTKLVTLSACDTGVGEVKNGEGVYGLRRAFVLAGTETLVMSMWPVSDYVTRELMTAYYRGLKQGQGRGEALRQVQLSMLKRKGRDHPFYWASFIQSGEWANLDGKR